MKLRTFLSDLFGSIKEALTGGSQVAAVIHGLDSRAGKRGARGKHDTKNPFRGIACSNGSSYGQKFFRHIEGARDTRPAFPQRRRGQLIRKMFFDGFLEVTPFRDSNPIPCAFIP